MSKPKKAIIADFYKKISGAEPVREWLKSLNNDEMKKIGADIMSVEFGWPIGMPTVRPLGRGLHEVRTSLGNRISRVFFFVENSRMVLLHGIIKKDQKIPKKDIDLARSRMKKARGKNEK